MGVRPESGLTASHPCGADTTAALITTALIDAGSVAESFCAAGMVALFTWYEKLSSAGLTVGIVDCAFACQLKALSRARSARANFFMPLQSAA
jgi:hypothetical protein